AQGVGDPFHVQAFSGDLFVQVTTPDIGPMRDMFAASPTPVWATGAIDVSLWLSWENGRPAVAARLDAQDLQLAPREGDWSLPLERLALEAHVVRERDHWTLYASNVVIEQDNMSLALPRLQLDAWGNALRARAADVSLAPLNGLLLNSPALPDALRDVLSALDLSGELQALQVSVGDVAHPGRDWEVEANFSDVALESYRGAPGAYGARGYALLGPGGGAVTLDATNVALKFPDIYRQPLTFDELYGSLSLAWDRREVSLSSGVLTAVAEEGRARALLGLNIPLTPTQSGVEMSLLVGLPDSHTRYRQKYIPYVLAPGLLNWLETSIGDGRIAQGAFLWRGSLRPDAAPLRTVQLAFDVADLAVDYHPDWPAVTLYDGTLLIDDGRVSAWAGRARLLDSAVEGLSVETWPETDAAVGLAVAGRISGPVADGLAVVNQSPLNRLVGGAFSGWRAAGELATDLTLQMRLGEQAPAPRVGVHARLQDVEIDIVPGDVPLRAVQGDILYSSLQGFSSEGLRASLWDKPISAHLRQSHAIDGAYDPRRSTLEVAVDGAVSMADIRRWLRLPQLAFAEGESRAAVSVRVAPEQPPLLTVRSDLKGTRLDLPSPWNKGRQAGAALRVEMPLGGEARQLAVSLDDAIHLRLALEGNALRGAAMGIGVAAAPVETGVLRVAGEAPVVDGKQWLQFIQHYLAPQDDAVVPLSAVAGVTGDGSVPVGDTSLKLSVAQFRAGELRWQDRSVEKVSLSFNGTADSWTMEVGTDWLRAEAVKRDEATDEVALNVEWLDLVGLREAFAVDDEVEAVQAPDRDDAGQADAATDLELPVINVQLTNIVDGAQALGELSFTFVTTADSFSANALQGELAFARFDPEEPGRLTWGRGDAGQTRLETQLVFDDLGATLETLGYQRILETEGGRVAAELSWPGAPTDFSLAGAAGTLQLAFGDGSFPEAPAGASGALRVVSILNLVDIVQRLSLAHMFESGIPFDSLSAEVYLHAGTIEVSRAEVSGGSSFQFSGVSDVAARSLAGELVATLPVAKNLPWVAALAASLPVAAGVFVVSKIFDKQMNRLSSGVYRIEGTWDDPQVSFDRIFDDSTELPELLPNVVAPDSEKGTEAAA
ncbi:MAG: hypothetical protein KDI09_14640, partial [Halioglobus sp.]|nr:hypothetical protein [Halioglobus sp.]